MKKMKVDKTREAALIAAQRHLDLNHLMRDHFCKEEPKPKKKGKKKK